MSSETAAFTIIAKNYLPYARVLMSSVAFHHPEWRRFVILVDTADGYFDARWENFELIDSAELGCPKIKWFQFKYSTLELSTAFKPYAFTHLFETRGFRSIVYLDPDIKLFSRMEKVTDCLAGSNIVLTPHLTQNLDDGKHPNEISILRTGAYNLGFIAVARSSTSLRFLRWWEAKLVDHCVVDLAQGLFVDQRWIDLVPGLFEGVAIVRDEGYNVAYWNLGHREIAPSEAGLSVGHSPLAFVHFSGYDPSNPGALSRHQNRLELQELSTATQSIFSDYGRDLLAAGLPGSRNWPYTFSSFRNGVEIPDLCRMIHHEAPEILDAVDDPFSDRGFQLFVEIWNSAHFADFPGISKLAYRIYQVRTDVRRQMPDIFGRDYRSFLSWMSESGMTEHKIPAVFLEPINQALAAMAREQGEELKPAAVPTLTELNEVVEAGDADNRLRWTRLSMAVYHSRPDVQAIFPNVFGADRIGYLQWFLTRGRFEHRLSQEHLLSLEEQWQVHLDSSPRAATKLARRVIFQRKYAAAFLNSLKKSRRLGNDEERSARIPHLLPAMTKSLPDAGNAGAGVNLVGYLHSETGVGQSGRSAYFALKEASLEVDLVGAGDSNPSRKQDYSAGPITGRAQYAANLFYVNADQSHVVKRFLGPALYQNRVNIGYWAWELDEFPSCWESAFSIYQEIWTPSSFCRDAIQKKSPIPTVCMPHSVAPTTPQGMGRAYFGLPEGQFIFLTAFDVLSVVERKNPLATVRAFQAAFQDDPNFVLLVKLNNAPAARQKVEALRAACSASPNIQFLDCTLRREEMYALLRCSDCFVSLHRSEGFGLLIAEAMYFGKPVVVTNYSGNTDFTRPGNSFLVNYRLVPVGAHCSPYQADGRWAEADIHHAAHQMRTVFAERSLRERIAREGSDFVHRELNARTIGAKMRQRLGQVHPGIFQRKAPEIGTEQPDFKQPEVLNAIGVGV